MTRDVALFIHLLGVAILLGNVTATSVWKVMADRTCDARIIIFAQRLVTVTDIALTSTGIVLLVVGGYGAARALDMDLFASDWLIWSQVLFLLSGLIWLFVLVPIQFRQAAAVRAFDLDQPIPAAYRMDSRRWLAWGVLATIPLVAAMFVMIAKP